MASARVGSPIASCQSSTGSWVAIIGDFVLYSDRQSPRFSAEPVAGTRDRPYMLLCGAFSWPPQGCSWLHPNRDCRAGGLAVVSPSALYGLQPS